MLKRNLFFQKKCIFKNHWDFFKIEDSFWAFSKFNFFFFQLGLKTTRGNHQSSKSWVYRFLTVCIDKKYQKQGSIHEFLLYVIASKVLVNLWNWYTNYVLLHCVLFPIKLIKKEKHNPGRNDINEESLW